MSAPGILNPDRVLTRGLGRVTNPVVAAEAALYLFHESRLLDERRFDEWLELFTDDCLYWIPTSETKLADVQVAIAFEDRRRLTDRVVWLQSTYLHAQSPPSRTVRQISNVEAWDIDGMRIVKSTLSLAEMRSDVRRVWSAHVEHQLRLGADGWRIWRKTVLLLDFDKPIGNIAFAF